MNISEYGLIFAVISPFLSSISTIFRSEATKTLGPFPVLSFSALLGSVFLFIIIFVKHKKISVLLVRQHWRDLLTLTFTRQLLGQLLFTFGLYYTLSVKAIFLTKIEPYFVVFWFWLLRKEKIHTKHLILLGIHVAGAVILSGGDFSTFTQSQFGDLLIILAMCCFSYSYFSATKVSHTVGAMQGNAFMLLLSGLFFLPFVFLSSKNEIWNPSGGWVYLVLDAFIFSSISLTMWFVSLRSVKGWMVSALRALGPLVGAPFAYFVLGQTLTPVQIVGGSMVLATSFIIALEHGKWLRTHKIL